VCRTCEAKQQQSAVIKSVTSAARLPESPAPSLAHELCSHDHGADGASVFKICTMGVIWSLSHWVDVIPVKS
jgi:hypothetical protein